MSSTVNPTSPAALESLLKRLSTTTESLPTLSPADVQLIAHSLLPSQPRTSRSLAYLCLSKFCSSQPSSSSSSSSSLQPPSEEAVTEHVVTTLAPFLRDTFGENCNRNSSLNDSEVPLESNGEDNGLLDPIPFTYLLSSLSSLHPLSSIRLLTQKLENTIPSSDPLDILLETAELPSDLQPALAELLAQLAGSKPGRTLVQSRAEMWLRGGAEMNDGSEMSVLCAVALSKMGREEPLPGESEEAREERQDSELAQEEALCRNLISHVEKLSSTIGSNNNSSILPTLEGLSILSTRPQCKRLLSHSPKFLAALLSFSPIPKPLGGSLPVTPRASMNSFDESALFEPVETGLCFGLTTILVNLTSRRKVRSEEDEQVARIRRMAISGKSAALKDEIADPEDENEAVIGRVKRLVEAGVVDSLRGLVRASTSLLVMESVGKLCLNLVEEVSDRLNFIRQGGFKSLSTTIRHLSTLKPISETSNDDLFAYQALAKLTITTPPHLLFPPPYQTTALNALTPLYTLLVHPNSSSLQQFESLMALTNLASINNEIGSKITSASITPPSTSIFGIGNSGGARSKDSGVVKSGSNRGTNDASINVLTKIEELLLDENTLIRRAATQLVCNLVGSETGFSQFTGENRDYSAMSISIPKIRGRLSLLFILTDVDDIQTCIAASGALAIVTESDMACSILLTSTFAHGGGDGIFDTGAGLVENTITTTSKRNIWDRLNALFIHNLQITDEDHINNDDNDNIRRGIITEDSLSRGRPNDDLMLRAAYIVLNLLNYVKNGKEKDGVKREMWIKSALESGLKSTLMGLARERMESLKKNGSATELGSDPLLEPLLKSLKLLE